MCKNAQPMMWLNSYTPLPKDNQATAGVWASYPSPSLSSLHRHLATTKPQLNMVCLEGALSNSFHHLSAFLIYSITQPVPLVQHSAAHSAHQHLVQ